VKNFLIALVKFYRRNISPYTKPSCRFVPTCSAYALEAYKVHGFFKGTALTVWRILRCNPFCKGGYDPVPEKKKK
jgi:putative membrane protein insertion efficiency factor